MYRKLLLLAIITITYTLAAMHEVQEDYLSSLTHYLKTEIIHELTQIQENPNHIMRDIYALCSTDKSFHELIKLAEIQELVVDVLAQEYKRELQSNKRQAERNFFQAIRQGNITKTKAYLKAGIDSDTQDKNRLVRHFIDQLIDFKRTALVVAKNRGHHDIVQLLLKYGAQDISATTPGAHLLRNGYDGLCNLYALTTRESHTIGSYTALLTHVLSRTPQSLIANTALTLLARNSHQTSRQFGYIALCASILCKLLFSSQSPLFNPLTPRSKISLLLYGIGLARLYAKLPSGDPNWYQNDFLYFS